MKNKDNHETPNRPRVKTSTVVANNPWTRVLNEQLVFPDGRAGEYLIIERPVALAVLPIVKRNGHTMTVLVRQYRHPISQSVLQFPMGGLDPGKSPEQQARDELRQETGLRMTKFTQVADYFVDPGLSRQRCIVFVAEGIEEQVEQELEATESDLTFDFVPIQDLAELERTGAVCDSWTLAQAHLLRRYLDDSR